VFVVAAWISLGSLLSFGFCALEQAANTNMSTTPA